MDMISLEGKTNFFEKRVAEYQKSGVMASLAKRNAATKGTTTYGGTSTTTAETTTTTTGVGDTLNFDDVDFWKMVM